MSCLGCMKWDYMTPRSKCPEYIAANNIYGCASYQSYGTVADQIADILGGMDSCEIRTVLKLVEEKFAEDSRLRRKRLIEEHKKYVGKCFKNNCVSGYKYYKVISEIGPTEFHVSCICFDEVPYCEFQDFSGRFNCYPILFEDVAAASLEDMAEISPSEFNEAAEKMLAALLNKEDWTGGQNGDLP